MTREITFRPFKKQYAALQLLRDNVTNEVLYGGGARGAKTYLGCSWCIINAFAMPGSAGLVGRNELKRLKATTLITFYEVAKEFGLQQGIDYKYNAQDSIITFNNGSIIFLIDLSYMPSDPNYDRLGSYGITYAFIDEAQEVANQAINVLKGRYSKLSGDGWSTIPKALYTCNPAKNWIYHEFYLPYKNGTLRSDRAFIPSLVTDNPSIAQEYIDNLKKADKVTVERLLYGNFEYDDQPGRLFEYEKILDMKTNPKYNGTRYISCDAARKGKDKAVISVWDGLEEVERIVFNKCLNTDIERKIQELSQRYGIGMSNVIVDEDGVGGGIVDSLECTGFINNSLAISPYGSRKTDYLKRNFSNLKTQCYFELAKYVNQNKIRAVYDSNFDLLVQELDIIVQIEIDKDGPIRIIKKEDMKEKLGRSPDFSDTIMMRMYYELLKDPETGGEYVYRKPNDNPYDKIDIDAWERMLKEEEGQFNTFDEEGGIFDDKLDGDVL